MEVQSPRGASLNWEDAPVECSRLFLARYRAFMKDWVLGNSSKQILGRVQHHVTRIEVQHHGSLHVHILLWVHPDDVACVADEIMAYVPAVVCLFSTVPKPGTCNVHNFIGKIRQGTDGAVFKKASNEQKECFVTARYFSKTCTLKKEDMAKL